jgi:hypothetical protein
VTTTSPKVAGWLVLLASGVVAVEGELSAVCA